MPTYTGDRERERPILDIASYARRGPGCRDKLTPADIAVIARTVRRSIGETGSFTDWGGERNDLFTSKIHLKGKRRAVAFAFKGPGTSGALTPRKLGKNGDQIQRLFLSPAEVFVIQYHGQIECSRTDEGVRDVAICGPREADLVWGNRRR